MARAPRPEDLTLGLALVALGVLWIFANLGRIDLLHAVRTWWPATLVVWGGLELATTLSHRRG